MDLVVHRKAPDELVNDLTAPTFATGKLWSRLYRGLATRLPVCLKDAPLMNLSLTELQFHDWLLPNPSCLHVTCINLFL